MIASPDRPHVSAAHLLLDPTRDGVAFAAAEAEFMHAMQAYKIRSGRMFPTWSEVLEVLRALGYEKVGQD